MAWYSCELSFLVQFTPASLVGLTDAARGASDLRALSCPYQDYLLGQVSGSTQDRQGRLAAIRDFLHGPDCRFLLPHPPGRPEAWPSLDELRQRATHALAVYRTLNPDLRFAETPLGELTNLRWDWRAGRRAMVLSWQLAVVDRGGRPIALPPRPARAGAYHVAVEVLEPA